jgi:hypothetical protein
MTREHRLAHALVTLVFEHLDRGVSFLRLPEFVTPFPVEALLAALRERSGVRVALFIDDPQPAVTTDGRVTTSVATAIDWRNDARVDEALLIVGNLERDRAAGLADVPTLRLEDVRRRLFEDLVAEVRHHAVPQLVTRLLRACAEFSMLTDLLACSDYCESLLPVDGTTAERAKKELWRIGLFPDLHATEIDLRRLQQNTQLVLRVRGMDASTRQRLIRHLGESTDGDYRRDYTPLRRFASTGDFKYLVRLDFSEVQNALRSTQQRTKPGSTGGEPDDRNDSVVRVALEPDYDENAFLDQVQRTEGTDDKAIIVGPLRLEWDYENLEPTKPLLSDPDAEEGYEAQAGSVERIRPEEPFPQPGKGQAEWRGLPELAENLRILEKRSGSESAQSAVVVDRLVQLRRVLLPVIDSILNEGVRLFILSPQLRRAAAQLVESWVELWRALEDLRGRLSPDDHVYVRRIAERLASTDLRITAQGADINAYVLPLHPTIVEPRVRAAELFLQEPNLPEGFFELVAGSLDPAMPSISILLDGAPVSLGYAGRYKGLLHYARMPRQVDSSDVNRTLQEIVQRFINVHPYASLSLSVGLLDPPPKSAKAMLRWLGEADPARVALHAYTTRRDAEEIRAALDEAKEELVSGEVSAKSFEYEVLDVRNLGSLAEQLAEAEQVPHVLFMFDIGDVEQSGSGASFSAPPLGSLVSEWMFDTDPLEHARPVIRPRSGSGLLTEFLAAQAGLFEMPLPSQQRSPLLSPQAEAAVQALADRTTWLVLCEGVSALVPPLQIGDLHLVGRMTAGSHVAFVYSSQVLLLLEPVLGYLWQSTWIDPDRDAVLQFLLGTVRMALPEGLLGFFKARGALSKESVLGRLGFAAAMAYLNEAEAPKPLIVSLDTEGARRWLGLREGKEKRADLVVFREAEEGWLVEAVEVKARSERLSWLHSPPEAVQEAITQVGEMESLLLEIFQLTRSGPFTASRREILKRQVFLEAFQQWEGLRRQDEVTYTERIDQLNKVFAREVPVTCGKRVLLVNPNQTDPAEARTIKQDADQIPLVMLGVPWLRRALEEQPGAVVEISTDLLDELGVEFSGEAPVPTSADRELPASPSAPTAPLQETDAEPTTSGDEAVSTSQTDDEAPHLAQRLREAFVARNAPFRIIEAEHAVTGPAVIQIPFSVPAGAKLAQLQNQEADLARDIGVQSVRISNWIGHPGYAVAELPRSRRIIPDVTSLTLPEAAAAYPMVALGAQLDMQPLWVPHDELPHLLVAGTTGSGKSIFLRSILWQLTHLYEADKIDLILVDAKGMADYLDFINAPHFKDEQDFHSGVMGAMELLEDVVQRRLQDRTAQFRQYATQALRRDPPVQVTNLRELVSDAHITATEPAIRPLVIVVDEFAELVLGSADRRRFEAVITRFVQVARAIGGHLIAATQRPSTDIVTGVMKANFARVALRVQQSVDSRVILDENGAESLLGRGDLLFKSPSVGLVRLQGFSAVGPFSF